MSGDMPAMYDRSRADQVLYEDDDDDVFEDASEQAFLNPADEFIEGELQSFTSSLTTRNMTYGSYRSGSIISNPCWKALGPTGQDMETAD